MAMKSFGLLLLLSSTSQVAAKLGESHLQPEADRRELVALQFQGSNPSQKLGRCEGDCDRDSDWYVATRLPTYLYHQLRHPQLILSSIFCFSSSVTRAIWRVPNEMHSIPFQVVQGALPMPRMQTIAYERAT